MTSSIFVGNASSTAPSVDKKKNNNNNKHSDDVVTHPAVVVYKEVVKKVPIALDNRHPLASTEVASLGTLYADRSRYETTTSGHVSMPSLSFDPDKVLPTPLVNLQFSADSAYIASHSETLPNAIWIWDVARYKPYTLAFHDITFRKAVCLRQCISHALICVSF